MPSRGEDEGNVAQPVGKHTRRAGRVLAGVFLDESAPRTAHLRPQPPTLHFCLQAPLLLLLHCGGGSDAAFLLPCEEVDEEAIWQKGVIARVR
jgi:hypothetical protein